jgi:opacity protein-like surface antigen
MLLIISQPVYSQDLMDLLGEDKPATDYAYGTFKTTRVVLNHSIQAPAKGDLIFIISHHFGEINSGLYNFMGLDAATIRLGFEYGLNDRLSVGVGRGTWKKMFDGHVKYLFLKQSSGAKNMPISLSYFGSIGLNSLHWEEPNRTNFFSSRLSYVHQLLIARKFGNAFSLQLTPTLVHRNLVKTNEDQNNVFATGLGGRVKLSQRVTLNAEYFYLLPGKTADDFNNSLSLGFDIETGGHVFQVFCTNSNPITEHGFITETTGNWADGDIFIGFNITRTFTLSKKKMD